MNNLTQYFQTKWTLLTLHDWIGLVMTVTVFLLMIAIYVYVLNPKRKAELEAQRYIPLDEDELAKGSGNE